jgi:hypothetical protein
MYLDVEGNGLLDIVWWGILSTSERRVIKVEGND